MNKQFPIGKLFFSEEYSPEDLEQWIDDIALLPERIRNEIEGHSDDILLSPYREGGWTVRQVIGHSIRPYDQDGWVKVDFQFGLPLELTLNMLENTHEMMVRIYQSLDEKQLKRTFTNPESGQTFTLAHSAALYAWHSNHHLAHIRLVTQDSASSE